MENTWYKVEEYGGTFYTHNISYGRDYLYLGDGEKKPTPKEITEYLNSGGNRYNLDSNLGLFYTTNKLKTNADPIRLPAGIYAYDAGSLKQLSLRHETLIELNAFKVIKNDIYRFLESKQVYTDLNMCYKLGILLYGAPGNSKSMSIRTVINSLDVEDKVVIYFPTFPHSSFINQVNKSLSNRVKIFVFEELTEMVRPDNTKDVLDFLDGEMSPTNCIIFGTTNYPDKLAQNIVDRAGRFDKLYEFKSPNQEDRQALVRHFLKRDATPLELTKTEKLTVADIKEACISSLLNGTPLVDAAAALTIRREVCNRYFQKAKVGI